MFLLCWIGAGVDCNDTIVSSELAHCGPHLATHPSSEHKLHSHCLELLWKVPHLTLTFLHSQQTLCARRRTVASEAVVSQRVPFAQLENQRTKELHLQAEHRKRHASFTAYREG